MSIITGILEEVVTTVVDLLTEFVTALILGPILQILESLGVVLD